MSIPPLYYTQMPNVIFDYWAPRLSPSEFLILSCLCRKIFGWKETSDFISLSQYEKLTGLTKKTIINCLKKLERHGLVIKKQSKNPKGLDNTNEYGLNIVIPAEETPPVEIEGSVKITPPLGRGRGVNSTLGVVENLHTQKKGYKDIDIKKDMSRLVLPHDLTSFFYEQLKIINVEISKPNLETWAKEFDLMLRVDGRDEKNIRKVIAFLVQDRDKPATKNGFKWSNVVLSPNSLRKNYAQIWAQMNEPLRKTTETSSTNEAFVRTLEKRYEKMNDIVFGTTYIEFKYGAQATTIEFTDKDFKNKINKHLEYKKLKERM